MNRRLLILSSKRPRGLRKPRSFRKPKRERDTRVGAYRGMNVMQLMQLRALSRLSFLQASSQTDDRPTITELPYSDLSTGALCIVTKRCKIDMCCAYKSSWKCWGSTFQVEDYWFRTRTHALPLLLNVGPFAVQQKLPLNLRQNSGLCCSTGLCGLLL